MCDIFTLQYHSQPITTKLKKENNTANIFLTIRNYVNCFSLGIFCIMFKMLSTVKISIRRNRSDKTMEMQIRLLLKEKSDQDLHCSSFYLLLSNIILQRKSKLFNFMFLNTYFRCSNFPGFHRKKCLLIAFECSMRLLWAVTIRIVFLLDQAGESGIVC